MEGRQYQQINTAFAHAGPDLRESLCEYEGVTRAQCADDGSRLFLDSSLIDASLIEFNTLSYFYQWHISGLTLRSGQSALSTAALDLTDVHVGPCHLVERKTTSISMGLTECSGSELFSG